MEYRFASDWASRAICTLLVAFPLSGLDLDHLRQSGRPGWSVSLTTPAYADFSCEYPPVDEPDADGDECDPNDISNTGISGNQSNTLNALRNAFSQTGGALPLNFLGVFNPTYGNTNTILSQLSGEAATGGQQVTFQQTSNFLSSMTEQTGGESVQAGESSLFSQWLRRFFGFTANLFPPPPPISSYPYAGIRGYAEPKILRDLEKNPLYDTIAFDGASSTFPPSLAYASARNHPVSGARSPKVPDAGRPWSVWASGSGGYSATEGDVTAGTHRLSTHAYGGAAGINYHITPDMLIGLALSGVGSDWDLAQGLGRGHSDAFQLGLHGRTHAGPVYLTAALAFSQDWMSTDRYAVAGDHLTANFIAYDFGGRIEGGYRIGTTDQGIAPYAAFQRQRFHAPAHSETDLTAGGFGLSYASQDVTRTRGELGVRFDALKPVAMGVMLQLNARFAWAHDWTSSSALVATFQSLPGASFAVDGATPPEDSLLVSAGAGLRFANGVSLAAKFDGDFGNGSKSYTGTGSLRYSF